MRKRIMVMAGVVLIAFALWAQGQNRAREP